MKTVETGTSVAEAVEFLTSRVAEEARKDAVPLTDVELKQLAFTEETATPDEIAAASAFDEANNSEEFEAKITKLLRSAFRHDAQHGMRAAWQKHLAALRDHDIYVLVMVDQAGISRPKPTIPRMAPFAISPTMLVRKSPDILAGLVAFCGFIYFFVFHIGWSRSGPPILGNFAEHLLPSESIRGIFLWMWLGSMAWLMIRFNLRD